MTYGNGTVVLPIMRRVFIGALVGIYAYTAVEVAVKPGYARLVQRLKKGSGGSGPAAGGGGH